MDDDDALDMFADSLDDKTVGKGLPQASAKDSKNGASTVIKNGNAEAKPEKKEIVLDEIMWEFKWENTEGMVNNNMSMLILCQNLFLFFRV